LTGWQLDIGGSREGKENEGVLDNALVFWKHLTSQGMEKRDRGVQWGEAAMSGEEVRCVHTNYRLVLAAMSLQTCWIGNS
jgi:hypothetical protein